MAIREVFQIVAQVKACAPNDCDTAKGRIVGVLAHHFRDSLVTEKTRDLGVERIEQSMEFTVGMGAGGGADIGVAEGTQVGLHSFEHRVPQHLLTIVLVEPVRANTLRKAYDATLEEFLQL